MASPVARPWHIRDKLNDHVLTRPSPATSRGNNKIATGATAVSVITILTIPPVGGVFVAIVNVYVLSGVADHNEAACIAADQAISAANATYESNPARQAFNQAVDDANDALAQQCDDLEAQEEALIEEMQNNYENLLQDCLDGSFPCP